MAQLERRNSTVGRYPSISLLHTKKTRTQVFGWGRGDLGQLGNHSENNLQSPTRIHAFDEKDIVHLAGNEYNSAAITGECVQCWTRIRMRHLLREVVGADDGEAHAMGSNDHGQLGSKDRKTRLYPELVQALDVYQLVQMAMGQMHTLAITEKVSIQNWGGDASD